MRVYFIVVSSLNENIYNIAVFLGLCFAILCNSLRTESKSFDHFISMVDQVRFEIPANYNAIESITVDKNFTLFLNHIEGTERVKLIDHMTEEEYRALINNIWIGVIVTLIIVSFVVCLCSCFMYHKFEMWKRNCKYLQFCCSV